MITILRVIVALVCLYAAVLHFQIGRTTMGGIYLCISAMNVGLIIGALR